MALQPYDGEISPLDDGVDALKPYDGDLKPMDYEPPAKPEGKGITGHARDLGLSALKSAIAVPEAVVGLADIPTGGAVGKFLENKDGAIGFRPKEARDILSDLHTDQYKAQQREFQDADGVLDKAAVALKNPSLIANTVVESAAPMLAGGVAARGIRALAPSVSAAAAGAIGEGATMAGSQTEAIRQQTDDGLLTGEQSGAAVATGALGTLFGFAGGRLAQRLGIGDVDTMLARGAATSDDVAAELARTPAKSIPRQVVEGAISEGFLEELPQSISEQIIQNLALNKPWSDGVADAAVMGTLAGMAMGGGAALARGLTAPPRPDEQGGSQPQADQQAAPPPAESIFSTGDAPVLDDRALERAGVTPPPPAPVLDKDRIAQALGDAPQQPVRLLPAPVFEAGADGTIRTTADINAGIQADRQALADRMRRLQTGEVLDVTPIPTAPELPSQQMGLDPSAGPMSAAAALAVDSGASPTLQAPAPANTTVTPSASTASPEALQPTGPDPVAETFRTQSPVPLENAQRLARMLNDMTGNEHVVIPSPDGRGFGVRTADGLTAEQHAAVARFQTQAGGQRSAHAQRTPTARPQVAEQWDTMPAEERAAVLAQKGGWSAKSGFLNVIGKRLMAQGWKDIPDSAKARIKRLVAERETVGQAEGVATAGAATAAKAERGLDHGELNIPGRTQGIDAELDRHKRELARAEKAQAKTDAQQRKDDKTEARRLFAEVGPAMRETLGPKLGDKELGDHLGQMVKWEPRKFIALAHKFQAEQAASALTVPSEAAKPTAEPAKPAARKPKSPAAPSEVRWLEMTLSEREAVALSIGQRGIFAQKTAEKRWDRLPEKVRESLEAKMGVGAKAESAATATAEQNTPDAPVADGDTPAGAGLRATVDQPAPEADPQIPEPAGTANALPDAQPDERAAPEAQAASAAEKIADFGEKIGGARKDMWAGFKEKLGEVLDDDIASQPLSKVWPQPDYEALIDSGVDPWVAAFVRAARDEIPAKPRQSWKVARWSAQVRELRSLAQSVMADESMKDRARELFDKNQSLIPVRGRVDLYLAVGHGKPLDGVRLAHHHYSLYKGRENVSLWVVEQDTKATAFSNWPRELATGDTKEEAIAAFKARHDALNINEPASRQVSFDIYSKHGTDGFFIGKKIGRNHFDLAGPFKTVKETRDYKANEHQALLDRLEKAKEIPRERRDTNEPRVGEDMRNGQDVTPQLFGETFGFRGVEFGNWVEQGRRQQDLNDAFDALMDMAAVLGIPPKAISLNGELGLAFGARGSGGVHPAAAHYEPGKVVINLTKRQGAGSLGHEWWHAVDNYFSRMRGKGGELMTNALDVSLASRGADFMANTPVRREMISAFGEVMRAINLTALKARSQNLDNRRSKEYWTTKPEMSARAFESYLIAKLQDQNASNDYLANIVDEKTWRAAESLGFELDGSYPYPTAGEIPKIRGAFDNFFTAIQTRETERGTALFSFAGRSAIGADTHALGAAQRRIAAGEDEEAVRQETGWYRGADGKWRFEISDDQSQLAVGGNTAAEVLEAATLDGGTVRVADVLDHPQLFAAYPHIADILVELVPAGERAAGRMVRRGDDARLQIRGDVKRAAMTSVMLHELQHAIQHAEGFARGGSAKALASDLDRTGAETYLRLAGEVEARNTQHRQRMTAEQRRLIAPEDTADVSASDVIVTFNGQPVTTEPRNAGNRVPVTERGLLRALHYQFRGLEGPVEAMLAKGRRGEKGGLVVMDSADPLRIAGVFSSKTGRTLDSSINLFSEGGQTQGLYDPKSGLTFLVGPNLDLVTAPAVLLHEMVHGQQRAKIDAQAMGMLMSRGQVKDADLRAFLDRVAQRMVDADAAANPKEATAYIVELAVVEGRSRGYTLADNRFFAWVDSTFGERLGDFMRSVAAMVRTWMIRHGGIRTLTVDDLVGYAMAGVERAARGHVRAVRSAPAAESRRGAVASENLPDAIVANPLGAVAGADQDAAKAGDIDAAARLARQLVTPALLAQVRDQAPRDAVVVGVDSIEATGANALPGAAASLIAAELGLDMDQQIVQSTKPKRTTLGGLDRVFRSPEFDGEVIPGRAYVLVDDTLTQGGTFAALASHIEQNGGRVAAVVALTGKQYSSRLGAQAADIERLRTTYGDLEDAFRRATGYDFGGLTASEARYLANFRPTDVVRNRILAEAQARTESGVQGDVQQEVAPRRARDDDAPQFSRAGRTPSPRQIATHIGDGLKSITMQDVKRAGRHKLTDWLKLGLQFLGRRQLVDIYGDVLPLAEYDRLAAQMEADKNDVGASADDLARRWGRLPDERKLAELMHDATLAQIDADSAVPYAAGDDRAKSQMLKGQFDALTPEAQKVYREARDHYRKHHAAVREAIQARIQRSELRSAKKAELLQRMDDDFFQAIKGVYFPLARFGQYVVVVKDGAGKVASVSRAETMAEAEGMRREMVRAFPAADGYQVGRVTLSKEFVASRDMVGRGFMTELYGALDEQNLPPQQLAELEDTLGQLYLSSLPDLSWAKHGIHRKGTPGFSQDARRAFAQNTFHGARYLAKLKYGDRMQTELDGMQKHVDQMSAIEDFDQPAAQRVVDEMAKRHDAMMNPKSNPLSTALTSFGFIYYLGLSPAAAVVNLSQTPLVAYPVLGAKWGFKKAGAALMQASREAVQGKNDMRGQLKNADEIRAYDEAVRSGVIDVTMAHDLAGIAQGEDAKVMWKIRPVMRLASYLFHHAERFNRQTTFLAAYRLARETGAGHDAAYSQAVKATYDGHFDYSAGNRPRVMQGNVARVVLLFKQYAQNMIFTIARSAYQSVAGESPEVRREARKVFAALMTMHAAAAGVLGLPLVGTLLTVASAMGGSDDEPWDAEVALRNMLADAFGPTVSEVIARGFSRLTPWDISGRVGLDKLLLPDVQEGLEGQRWAESVATAMLGPVIGVGVNAAKGAQKMADGDFLRGIEDMLPVVARNPIKAFRYWEEGAQDRTGVSIKDEVQMAGVLGQAAGFSPSEVRLAFEGRSAVMDQDRRLRERRSDLMAQFARAAMEKDADGMTEARDAIAEFNRANPGRRITPPQMWQSVRNRQRRIDQAEEGVYLPRTRRDALEAGRFAGA